MKSKIKEELIEWLKVKKKNEMFILMCYASISFKKQRTGIHSLCAELAKRDKVLFHEIGITKYIICGWADDITTLIIRCYPDFKEKFGKGISVGEIEEIIYKELKI